MKYESNLAHSNCNQPIPTNHTSKRRTQIEAEAKEEKVINRGKRSREEERVQQQRNLLRKMKNKNPLSKY